MMTAIKKIVSQSWCSKYYTFVPQEFQKPVDNQLTASQFFLNNVELLNQVVPGKTECKFDSQF
jgi:hypothetical protein